MTGIRLSDYEKLQPLGQGGMASVSKARYRPTGEIVALKEMLPQIAANETFIARFEREARTSAGLVHPYIVRVQGWGCDEGTWFLALEFCDGGTLVDVLKRAPRLPPSAVAVWLHELLSALEAAHARGVVHRDIKPPNVLMSLTGHARLADFGIARSFGDETLTATGEVIGTPAYMSPEQALGVKDIDGRSDLYSLGILAYRMLAGANPYQSDNVATSLLKQTTGPSLQTADAMPACPPVLERVLDGLLIKDRTLRTQTATLALAQLHPLVDEIRALAPDLGARLVREPAATTRALFIDAAVAELRNARALVTQAPERAAISAYRARLLAPEHPEALRLLDELSTQHGIRVDDANHPDARVTAAERELDANPEDPALLRRLANLHRGHRNPVAAARYLKRYLRVRPDDALARRHLAELVGEHDATLVGGPRAADRADGASPSSGPAHRPLSTREVVAGVKTGGIKAAGAARATTWSTPESPPILETPTGFGWWKLVGVVGVLAIAGTGVVTVRGLIRSGSRQFEGNLNKADLSQNGMALGMIAETQRPLMERGDQSLRVGDFQGALEAYNFALAADQALDSALAGRLLLGRARCYEGLGNARQALLDFRLAATHLAPGSPEQLQAQEGARRMDGAAPPGQQ